MKKAQFQGSGFVCVGFASSAQLTFARLTGCANAAESERDVAFLAPDMVQEIF